MEELAGGVIKAILRIIHFIFVQTIYEFLFYWVGRLFLLVVTLGYYPRGRRVEEHENRIICTGFSVIMLSLILIKVYTDIDI